MKNILLPTDFSDNAWNAIKYALHFFENEACNFYLLHVNRLTTITDGNSTYVPTPEEIETYYIKPAKNQLKEILKKIAVELPDNKNHRFYTLTDYNFFIESIRKHVADKKIDYIVMGTKGATGAKEVIIGTNTGDVIRKVQCKTLIVPENANFTQIKEIAFPTDFSLSYSIQTLNPLHKIMRDHHSSMRILHVTENREDMNDNQLENKGLIEDFFAELSYSFHYLTNSKIEDAIQCFVESRDINLIVMVAKNLNYFQQILFHPRIEKISYHVDVPFLVLHE
ncbi:universal stress protein [Tenacibaculum sp. IB213877]|uniref:universal stress protein n=1 Tax=Tenacibaculum sp. IB213877 TaxID=3097351 RepID=UPI002A5A91A3|nr:universal stress protein [Tenacibaculum sp. IB213877]MDY0779321.1 universal stress protein [Tenacibaculum sp. IB213877]